MIGKNKLKDLEENGIYAAKQEDSCHNKYIFKLNGKKGYKEFISNNNTYYNTGNDCKHTWSTYYVKKATELEKAWLLECIKQNKFIPLKNIKLPQNEWLWKI